MSRLGDVLGSLAEEYYRASHDNGREARIVIPGLTHTLA
jgi:hypothetical protein